MSPRISFSHDFCQLDHIPVEQQQQIVHRSNSSGFEFDLCVRKSFDQDSSSADELFSYGMILPTTQVINNKNINTTQQHQLEEDKEEEEEKKSSCCKEKQKSFWKFKRSSSLNCGSSYGRSLCPLPLLSRSYSTGSANKEKDKTGSIRSNGNHLKPPLKKSINNYGYGGQVINPVLNVPSGNLFGLGSFFKDKNKKKSSSSS